MRRGEQPSIIRYSSTVVREVQKTPDLRRLHSSSTDCSWFMKTSGSVVSQEAFLDAEFHASLNVAAWKMTLTCHSSHFHTIGQYLFWKMKPQHYKISFKFVRGEMPSQLLVQTVYLPEHHNMEARSRAIFQFPFHEKKIWKHFWHQFTYKSLLELSLIQTSWN